MITIAFYIVLAFAAMAVLEWALNSRDREASRPRHRAGDPPPDDLTAEDEATIAALRAEWQAMDPPPDMDERILRRVREEGSEHG